jgi:hypothetical protein
MIQLCRRLRELNLDHQKIDNWEIKNLEQRLVQGGGVPAVNI